MAEREALQKEIEELQNLINDYKTAHGDAPASSAQWVPARHGSRRGQGSHYRQPYSAVSRPYMPHSAGTWRKTYSLNNKTAGGQSSHPAQSNPNQHISTTPGAAAAGDNSRLVRSDVLIRKVPDGQTKSKSEASSLHCATPLEKNRVVTASGNRTVLISATGKSDQGHLFNTDQKDCTSLLDQQSDSKKNIKPPLKSPSAKANPKTISPVKQKPATELNVKPCLPTDSLSSRTVIMPAGNRDLSLPPSTSSLQSQASSSLTKPQLKPDSDTSQTRMASSCHKKSRFTWVKKQEIANVSSIPKTEACPTNSSQSPVSASSSATTPARRVSGSNKRASRKPSLSLAVPKTSKYTWVSSSCSSTAVKASASTKVHRKPLSPRSTKVLVKTAQAGLEGPKKLKCTAPSSSISKKTRGGGSSASQVGHASRYRWKAAGQSATSSASASTLRSTHKATVYRWTAARSCQKGEKGPTSGLTSSPAHLNLLTTPLSTGAFKLRSRTKIIRRFTGSTPSLERRHSPVVLTLRSRYSLRRRTHAQLKTPSGVRRAQSKVLVSFGRHKLRRLSVTPTSPGTPKSGLPSPSMRSAPSHRVIKTRYKIDTRRAHAIHHSPALSYRVKRVQTARNLLQNRLRTTSERPWRGRGMRWIGGALYRVSANKLSRTNTTCTPNSRAGEWFSPDGSFYCTPGKTSATRYVANRAVQRSLAIIRQARQKKQTTKQYCMYYNRFGKCNHGDACPFIHDPDKVAVCTRFLRGTCKQTDGTCPFSHKVAKEKMPVCSYFLKGICNNSNCPYSHVYVSRKADVCKDFIRGYCPQGDKCKKKHTLVCPEFSSTGVCPRGSKCKLLHRQRAKRSGSISGSGPAKRARTRDASKRSEEGNSPPPESPQAGEGSSRSGSEKLPSFISLSSSPEPPDSTDAPQSSAAETQARGKTLHIKPRF